MNDTRAAQIQWATWLLLNKGRGINYSEGPERMNAVGVWPPKFPISLDCSSFCTLVAWLANGNDPNGTNFNHTGYTGTMLDHCLHIPQAQAVRGDYVVYGPGTGDHVAFIIEVHGKDILTISMGQQGDPEYVWINQPSIPSRGYPVDGRQPQTFLANHTDTTKNPRTPLDLHPIKKILTAPLAFLNQGIQKIIALTKKP